jgi:hypothetical protein
VIVNDLHINGNGLGTNGISITGGANVIVENSEIWGFTGNGISFTPSAGGTLDVVDSIIHTNAGNGLLATGSSVTLQSDTFEGNTCGVAIASTGSSNFATNCGTGAAGGAGTPTVDASNTTISGSSEFGLLVNGSSARADIAGTTVTANGTGLSAQNGGQLVEVGAGNAVFGNGTDGAPTSTQGAQAAQGPAGPAGPQGAQGPTGVGQTGPAGPAGAVEIVTCTTSTKAKRVGHKTKKLRVRTCQTRLVSGSTTFKAAAASLSGAGRVLATRAVTVR